MSNTFKCKTEGCEEIIQDHAAREYCDKCSGLQNIPMTPDEFAKAMREAVSDGDPELGHINMDDLMVKVLKSLGYSEGVDVFENTSKWYS